MNSIRFIRLSALLVLLCIFGSGCFTRYAQSEAYRNLGNFRSIVERTGNIVDGKDVFAVDIVERTHHRYLPFNCTAWNTRKQHHLEFPLNKAPEQAPCFDLLVESDENADSVSIEEFNLRYVPQGNTMVNCLTEHYSIAKFELSKEERAVPGATVCLKVHPNDIGFLSLPFILKSYFYDKDNFCRRVERLMIPYKVEGKHFLLYTISWKGDHEAFTYHSPSHHDINISTVISSCILFPPALALDIITAPIVVPGYIMFCIGLSRLGP